MSRHMMPVMLGLTILPTAAILIAVYMLAYAGSNMAIISGAILLLGACVLATAVTVITKLGRFEDWLYTQDESLRELAGRTERNTARLGEMERQIGQPDPALERLATDISHLRAEVKNAMARRSETERAAQAATAQQQAADREAPPSTPRAKGEQLDLLLEPVIELSSGSTTHYRARLSLANGTGEPVGHDELVEKADLGGMRAALDAHLVKLVAPVLRRLRMRNPGLRIFVPLGRATLAARAEADAILSLLLADADVANGMVFEFTQQELGNLDATGIEGLARLGRLGATLALRDVYLGGLDLAPLRQLGVRFLDFPPHAVDAGSGPSDVWNDFVKYARAMQIQIMVGDIRTPQQAASASKSARFGYGAFFAPARKVRRDAGVAAAPSARRASVA